MVAVFHSGWQITDSVGRGCYAMPIVALSSNTGAEPRGGCSTGNSRKVLERNTAPQLPKLCTSFTVTRHQAVPKLHTSFTVTRHQFAAATSRNHRRSRALTDQQYCTYNRSLLLKHGGL